MGQADAQQAIVQALVSAFRGAARLAHAPLAARLARWQRQRAISRELAAYDDRELDELGIRRSEIPAVAKGRPVPRAGG